MTSACAMRVVSLLFVAMGSIGGWRMAIPAGGDCRVQIFTVGGYYIARCRGDCSTYAAPYTHCALLTVATEGVSTQWSCVCADSAENPTGHVQAAKACNATVTVDAAGMNPSWECYLDNPELCPLTTPPPSKKCIKGTPVATQWVDACDCRKP